MTHNGRTSSAGLLTLLFVLLSFPGIAATAELTVAVAANFVKPMRAIAEAFTDQHGHNIRLVSGSSGKLYAQIVHGAPYDIFFSADQAKPLALHEAGIGREKFTYAVGSLTLWSPDPELIDDGPQLLARGDYGRLSIANPKLAPYGLAAIQTLASLGLKPMGNQVTGENVAQAYQFVASGNATLGFVATSQVLNEGGSSWRIPAEFHAPILQDAIVLADSSPPIEAFVSFVRNRAVNTILSRFGYHLPEQAP